MSVAMGAGLELVALSEIYPVSWKKRLVIHVKL
jgi:hypothetical protein